MTLFFFFWKTVWQLPLEARPRSGRCGQIFHRTWISSRNAKKCGEEQRQETKDRTRWLVPLLLHIYWSRVDMLRNKWLAEREMLPLSPSHLDSNLFISLVPIIILPPSRCLLVCWLLDLTRLESLLPRRSETVSSCFNTVRFRSCDHLVNLLPSRRTGGLARETHVPT